MPLDDFVVTAGVGLGHLRDEFAARNRSVHFLFFGEMPMGTLSARDVDEWLDLLLSPNYLKLQQKTRQSYEHEFVLLSSFFRYYRNFADENFVSPILQRHRARACARPRGRNERIRFLKVAEEAAVLSALEQWPVLRDLALFQLRTGSRVGEAAALEFRNIDFERNEVLLVQHLHWDRSNGSIVVLPGTKTGPVRSIPLSRDCAELLLRRRSTTKSSKVFSTESLDWLAYRTIQNRYDRAFRSIGLAHSGTHVMRHTFAVRFLDRTKDIHALQRILGHADLETTQVYAKYSNESVRRSFTVYDGGLADADVSPILSRIPGELVSDENG